MTRVASPRGPRPHTFLAVVAILFVGLAGCASESSPTETAELQFEETLRLGSDDPQAADHELISKASEVAVAEDGTMYVVDGQGGAIRVYEKDGTFRRTIGQEGAGPGEFQRITALHVDRQGRLLAADPTRARITMFSADGSLVGTHQLPDVSRIVDIADLPDGGYAIVGSGNERLVHVVDASFSSLEASFVPLDEVKSTGHKLETVVVPYMGGSVAVPGPGTIVFAPALFSGTLYQIERQGDTWTRTARVEGPGGNRPAVSFGGPQEMDRVDMPLRMQDGRYAAQFHSLSWGVYSAPGDGLAHVLSRERDDVLALEVHHLSTSGTALGSTVIDTASALSLEALAMDADGSLYLSETRDVPQLVRLAWEQD